MRPNPALRKLGFADDDRVAIIHADDIGMCQATLTAFADLLDFGLVSCGAAMAPCPWFPSVAAYAAAHPDADIGVHLTLNCEYSTYRWGAGLDARPGVGPAGCGRLLLPASGRHAAPCRPGCGSGGAGGTGGARAAAAGIDVSHVDTHMGTVAHRKFAAGYVEIALTHRLPLMLMRYDEAGWRARGLDAETAAMSAAMVEQLEASGVPLVDDIVGMPLDAPEERIARAKVVVRRAARPASRTSSSIRRPTHLSCAPSPPATGRAASATIERS